MDNQPQVNKEEKPIILVGGGTGGHIFPLIAVGEELSNRQLPFIVVTGASAKEKDLIEEQDWRHLTIRAGKWRRYFTFRAILDNLADVFRTFTGFFDSIKILLRTKAGTVFSKGGYVALPMVIAAWFLGRRVIVHESDMVVGLSNRIASRFAAKVLVAFKPEVYSHFDQRYVHVGVPIRQQLRQAAELSSPKKSRPLIFVLAGSQGSSFINKLIRQNLSELMRLANIVHVTGELEYLQHRAIAAKLPPERKGAYKPAAFLKRELAYYYQSADLIVTRSSATVLAEAALFNKSVYLIPLPSAASNHQFYNAEILAKAGAAVYRQERSLSNEQFVEDLKNLLFDQEKLEEMGKKLGAYFQEKNAVEKIVKILADAQSREQ